MKKLPLLFLAFTLLFAGQLFAQTPAGREVSGVVQDTTGTGVFGATVTLTRVGGPGDTISIRTNADGIFVLKNVKVSQFNISVKSLGFADYNKRFLYTDGTSRIVLDKIILSTGAKVLEEVVITGAPPVTVKQDTIEFRASDFKLKENAVVEDLLKRVDGVEVDKDGNVTSQGKSVTKFRVNGKDYFGGDLKTATKNIPVDAIDRLQLVEDYGDQANFTGVRDGDPETIINITTRPGRNKGFIANATAGGGNDDLYQFSGFANQLQGERNLGIVANLNNNNTQVGGAGFGGRGGGGGGGQVNIGGGGNFGGGGGGGNFGGGGGGGRGGNGGGFNNNTGLTTLGSVGVNYSDRWSPKLTVTGAYYFNNNENNTLSDVVSLSNLINRQSEAVTQSGVASKVLGTRYDSHNINARFQYLINKSNQLLIMPSVTFYNSRNNTFNRDSSLTNTPSDALNTDKNYKLTQNTTVGGKSSTPSYGATLLFNHLFKKQGRNYSLNLSARNNELSSTDDSDDRLSYRDVVTNAEFKNSVIHLMNVINNQTFTGSARFVYSEPLSLRSRIQFSYNMNYSDYDNNKIANNIASGTPVRIDSLSNVFDYSFTSHQFGLNYNYRNQTSELSLGLSGNPTKLSGNSATLNTTISRSNFYIAPIIQYTYRYSRTKALMVRYFSRAVEPTFSQLQPVRDVSNSQRVIVGNPDLNSSFTHQMFANYNTSNPQKHTSFFFNLNGQLAQDRIVTNTIQVNGGTSGLSKQEVHYLNADGAHSFTGNYNWSKSFADRQYTFRLNGYAGYSKNVSFTNSDANYSKVWDFRQGLALMINPGTWLEFAPGVAYSLSNAKYTLATNTDTKIQGYSLTADGNVFFLKSRSLIFRFVGSKSFNSGYATSALNTSPLVVNTSIEKQFLKNRTATIKFQAFDIFNESNNITHTQTDLGFTDVTANRLNRYFMLTLTMRVNRFGGANAGGGGNQQRGGGFGGGGGGGFGGGGFGGGQRGGGG